MDITILLPARNEEAIIENTLNDILKFLSKRKILDYELLVIINGTTDRTEDVVIRIASKDKRIKVLKSRQGYGLSLIHI